MDIACPYRGALIPLLKNRGILGEVVHAQQYTGLFLGPFFVTLRGKLGVENLYDRD